MPHGGDELIGAIPRGSATAVIRQTDDSTLEQRIEQLRELGCGGS
jgi:hypothetical protein